MEPRSVPDEWDFYVCRVDDAAASISLNLWFEANAPLAGAETLAWLAVEMMDPGDRGVGTDAEAAALYGIEDAVEERAAAAGLYYVGRLRNHGTLHLAFYGPPDAELRLLAAISDVASLAGRRIAHGSKLDPDWHHYRELLLPSEERRRWMADRRVVEVLQSHGDPLQLARRVDHWLYFPSAEARDAGVAAAAVEGFGLEPAQPVDSSVAGKPDLRYAAQLHRIDAVELEHIHDVVMALSRLAATHGGAYDGWETSVEAA